MPLTVFAITAVVVLALAYVGVWALAAWRGDRFRARTARQWLVVHIAFSIPVLVIAGVVP